MDLRKNFAATAFATVAGLWIVGGAAWGQGCIVGRQCAPGAVDGNYLMPHQFEIGLNYRGFKANKHYNGRDRQYQREAAGNYVINRQNIWDLTGSVGLSKQTSAYIDIPYVNSGWSIPLPIGSVSVPHGPRYQQKSTGIGDVSVGVKYWVLDTEKHMTENVALGIGIKLPTGNANNKHDFPDINGQNLRERSVDQSIQPGDGGWGIPLSVDAFKSVKSWSFFGTWNYLINPRDTNGTPSIRATLGLPPSATTPSQQVNSVPDQYLLRLGTSYTFQKPGITALLAWRREGVPAKDLIGGHNGFRRPGYSTSIEPGLSYSHNNTTYTIATPITLTRNRVKTESDGVKSAGDSTFADSQLIVNITHRFGAH